MTLRACTLISDTRCGLSQDQGNSTEEEKVVDNQKEDDEKDKKQEDGVLVYEAKGHVEKGPPAFGTEKHQREELPGMSRSSTRDVHR